MATKSVQLKLIALFAIFIKLVLTQSTNDVYSHCLKPPLPPPMSVVVVVVIVSSNHCCHEL